MELDKTRILPFHFCTLHCVILTIHHDWEQVFFLQNGIGQDKDLTVPFLYTTVCFLDHPSLLGASVLSAECNWTRQGSYRSISVHHSVSSWPSIITGRCSFCGMELDKTRILQFHFCTPHCVFLTIYHYWEVFFLWNGIGQDKDLTVPFLYTTVCLLDHPSWLGVSVLSAEWNWTRQGSYRSISVHHSVSSWPSIITGSKCSFCGMELDKTRILPFHFCTPQCVFLTIHHYWEQVFFLWNGIGQDKDLTVPFLYTTVCLLDHPSLLGASVLSAEWNCSRQGSYRSISVHHSVSSWPSIITGSKCSFCRMELDKTRILPFHFCTPQCVFLTIHHYWEQVFFLQNGIGQGSYRSISVHHSVSSWPSIITGSKCSFSGMELDKTRILPFHFCTPQCVFLTIHHDWEQVFFLLDGIAPCSDSPYFRKLTKWDEHEKYA